jgi:hypothetical protein
MLNSHNATPNQNSTNARKHSPSAAEAVFARSGIEQNDVGRIAIVLQAAAEHCHTESARGGVA